jgi:hypothetical protein
MEKSEMARMMIGTILAEANLVKSDFARRLTGVFGASTVNRLLTTGQQLSPFHLDALLNAAGRIAGVPSVRLALALRRRFSPELLPEFELPFVTCKSLGNSELLQVEAELARVEPLCDEIVVYRPNLPLSLLEEEVAMKVIDYLANRYAKDPRLAKLQLQRFISDRHEARMNSIIAPGRRFVVITPISGLIRLAKIDPPFTGCLKSQIGASLASLLYDHVQGRNLCLVVLNDIVNPLARAWMAKYETFRSVTLFGSHLLLKRRQKTLACRILRATDGPEHRALIEYYRQDLLCGQGLACHGLTPLKITEFLEKFMDTSGYRAFRRYGSN